MNFLFPRLAGVVLGFSLLTGSFFTGCSSGHRLEADIADALPGHDIEKFVVLGTNDIHAALEPIAAVTREPEGQAGVPYERGGLTILVSHVKELRAEYGPELLWLDAGDQFQGTIDSNLTGGEPVVRILSQSGLDAAAIGNHEFDFGIANLKDRMKDAAYPFLAANVVEKKTGKPPAFPKLMTRKIFALGPQGRLKVGVFGLSTLETPTSTRAEFVRPYSFTDMKTAAIRESEALRKEGANVVILLAHSGLACSLGKAHAGLSIRKETDPLGVCGPRDELVQLLNALPPGTVDAAVSGHRHTIVHHWVNGVPVVEGGARAQYYNLIHLAYDWSDKRLVTDRTRIEGPVPVCPKIFENQGDCNGDRPAPRAGRGPLVTPKLFGHRIGPDADTVALLEPLLERTASQKKRVVGTAARAIEHSMVQESAMGNLVADALRAATGSDAALVNGGGVRMGLEAGPITYEAIFRVLPFDNSVAVLTLSGAELKRILRVAENGSRGLFSVSGLRLKLLDLSIDAPASDLNHDGKKELWEANRLLEARFANGRPISDRKTYKLATIDFLVMGGDDMGWPMSLIPQSRIKMGGGAPLRDVVIDYLGKAGPVNTGERPLIDPEKPRITLLKTKPSKRRNKVRSKRVWKKSGRGFLDKKF